ncbi:MAG TPA: molybdopterin-dependent oxidoreductase [Acidimicrobiia bacterium]|nr:molybdopterin-dependent oxidoreductase [Acidimicrobiia bacterium]
MAESAVSTGTPVGRRVFLGLVGAGALGVIFGKTFSDWFTTATRPIVKADKSGILGSVLPVEGFRYYTVTDGFPVRATTDWSLTVKGLVDHPFTLTYDELRALPATQLTKDFQCVTGWRVPDVHWTGVLLRDLLNQAGVQPTAKALRFTSFDGVYTESLTLDQARRDDVIVAYEMLGKPVTSDHGGPVRLYVAPMYGYKSCKWLNGIEVVDHVIPGYWENEGYDVNAWIGRSNGRDDKPV